MTKIINYKIMDNYKILCELMLTRNNEIDLYDLKDEHLINNGISKFDYQRMTVNQRKIINAKITGILKKGINLNNVFIDDFKKFWFAN